MSITAAPGLKIDEMDADSSSENEGQRFASNSSDSIVSSEIGYAAKSSD